MKKSARRAAVSAAPALLAALLCLAGILSLAACSSSGDGNVQPPGAGSTIDHTNYDPAQLSDAEVQAAAGLDAYFQHASVGGNVVDGLAALASETNSRYAAGSSSVENGSVDDPLARLDLAWFDANDGLCDDARGNPGQKAKIDYFAAAFADGSLADKLDVGSFKFCWIDDPSAGGQDYATGQALFDAAKASMEPIQAKHPKVAFVWWTMPIHQTEASAERQAYNDLVRAYCAEKGLWLLDIADLESHDDSGAAKVDADGIELLCPEYSSDGGHLSAAGERKLALAWWSLLAGVAAGK